MNNIELTSVKERIIDVVKQDPLFCSEPYGSAYIEDFIELVFTKEDKQVRLIVTEDSIEIHNGTKKTQVLTGKTKFDRLQKYFEK